VVVVSTLAASTVFSMQQAAVARAEKRRAEHDQALATRRYEEVRQLARHFLFELHASLEPVPGSLEVRRLVATQSLRQLDKLAADASGDPEILADLAAAYEKLGTVGIGVEETERIRRVAVALNEQVVRRAPGNDDFQAQLASSLAWLGNVLKLRGDRAGERESYQRSFTIMKGVVARNPDRRAHREQLKAVCEDLGRALAAQGRLDDAILHQRQALDMARSLARSYPSELAARRSVVISLHMLSTTLISADRWDEAGANYREALRLVRPLAAAHPENANYRRDHWFVKRGLARVLSRQGDHQAALAHLREALALKRSLLQADPADRGHQRGLAVTLLSLGEVLERSGDAEGALVEYERSVAAGERLLLLDPEVEETWTDLRLEYDRLHSLLGTMGRRSSQHQVREREAALYRRLRQRYPASKRAEAAVAPAPAFRLAGP
jgi:tetratricopeptide (TPR) repeat protein